MQKQGLAAHLNANGIGKGGRGARGREEGSEGEGREKQRMRREIEREVRLSPCCVFSVQSVLSVTCATIWREVAACTSDAHDVPMSSAVAVGSPSRMARYLFTATAEQLLVLLDIVYIIFA